jgi:succinate dehydrogenase / fumarate reductase iron-sulfur subunit
MKPRHYTLHVWRQKGPAEPGRMVQVPAKDVREDMSFLEMLDFVNEDLILRGEEPIAYEYDCREGICGTCSLVINGVPHSPKRAVTTCQVYMRDFEDGSDIYIEPFRAEAFPILKDLVADRSSLDRVNQAGGFVSVNTGGAQDANALPIPQKDIEWAMDAASCICCGACVAACRNASAMLFLSAKVAHLATLPQGQTERYERVQAMVEKHDEEGFGHCTNYRECEAVCPKEISVKFIAQLNRDLMASGLNAAPAGD